MKVLISSVSIKDMPAGVFSRGFNLAKGLVKRGNKVTFLTTQKNEFVFPYSIENRDGVEIIAFPSLSTLRIRKFGYTILPTVLKLFYILLKKYDVVHSDVHRPTSLFPCLAHRLLHKSILISDWQDFLGPSGIYDKKSKYWKLSIGPLDNWLELYSKKKSDGIVVLSDFLKEKTIELGVKENTIFKLWGGSDIDNIKFYDNSKENRGLFNISQDELVFIIVGMSVHEYEENLSTFKSIKKLRSNGKKIKIVRTGTPFSDYLRKKHEIGVEIVELGFIDYKYYDKLLSCADAFLLMQELNNKNLARWPNAIGDYIAAGRPIIANRLGELKELEKIFPSAFIIMQSTEEKYLFEKFKEIYENKQDLKNSYQTIREFACSNFSLDFRAEELEKIYNLLLKEKFLRTRGE